MFHWDIYFWCVMGILCSVLIPVLWKMVDRYWPKSAKAAEPASLANLVAPLWRVLAPYFYLGAASLVTGFLIVAISGDTLKDFRAALLVGYAWDSTLQKFHN